MSDVPETLRGVVAGGLCAGCGICAGLAGPAPEPELPYRNDSEPGLDLALASYWIAG